MSAPNFLPNVCYKPARIPVLLRDSLLKRVHVFFCVKVEEARRRLEELEHEENPVELTEADFNKKKEMLEFETREEIKDIREERY